MKISTTDSEASFKPFTLSIDLETKDEAIRFYKVFRGPYRLGFADDCAILTAIEKACPTIKRSEIYHD